MENIRKVEKALGSGRYDDSRVAEKECRKAQRSLWFVRDVAIGVVVTEADIAGLRGCKGVPTCRWNNVVGRVTKIAVKAYTPVTPEVLE